MIAADWKGRFGFHNFRHSLATALVKLKVDPKAVQGMLRHKDFGTTMKLYARRAGQIPGTVDGRQNSLAHGTSSENRRWLMGGESRVLAGKSFEMMVARDGVEPPTPAFSGLRSTT